MRTWKVRRGLSLLVASLLVAATLPGSVTAAGNGTQYDPIFVDQGSIQVDKRCGTSDERFVLYIYEHADYEGWAAKICAAVANFKDIPLPPNLDPNCVLGFCDEVSSFKWTQRQDSGKCLVFYGSVGYSGLISRYSGLINKPTLGSKNDTFDSVRQMDYIAGTCTL